MASLGIGPCGLLPVLLSFWRKQKLGGESCVPQARGGQNQNWIQAPWTEPLSPGAEGPGARISEAPTLTLPCAVCTAPQARGSGDRPLRASHACHRRPASPGCRRWSQPSAPDSDEERAQPWHFLQRERPPAPRVPLPRPSTSRPWHSECHPLGLAGNELLAQTQHGRDCDQQCP